MELTYRVRATHEYTFTRNTFSTLRLLNCFIEIDLISDTISSKHFKPSVSIIIDKISVVSHSIDAVDSNHLKSSTNISHANLFSLTFSVVYSVFIHVR